MKNIVDVMANQQRMLGVGGGSGGGVGTSATVLRTLEKSTSLDYKNIDPTKRAVAPRFLVECAIKLDMKPLTSATALVIFHRFYREVDSVNYDEFLIASSSLYLAGKIKDDPIKIRDVINVAYNTLQKGSNPLELSDEYWAMRDGIVQAELLITRMLKFDLNIVHPHKYMLHYMKSLQEWFGKTKWNSMPIAKMSAAYLQDFHNNSAILDYKPSHIACCCLSLAFQTYGIQVPLTDDFDENTVWYSVFAKDLTKDIHWEIVEKIMEVYNDEQELLEK